MARLEEAAILALVERGVAGASTTEIVRRAGLSQGALFQHYPTKSDLLVAAVRRLYARLRAEFQAGLPALPASGRTEALLWLAWRAFANPEAVSTLELYGASRTDPELRERLSPMLDEHWSSMMVDAAGLLPVEALADPALPALLQLTVASIQGAAPGAVVEGRDPPALAATFAFLARRLDALGRAPETDSRSEV